MKQTAGNQKEKKKKRKKKFITSIYFSPRLRMRPMLEQFERQRWGTSERQGGAHMGFSERIYTILNLSKLICNRKLVNRRHWTRQGESV